jgi:hypothetical protein
MKYSKLALCAVALISAAFAIAANTPTETNPVRTQADPSGVGGSGEFGCGLFCPDGQGGLTWITIDTCFEPYTCCGMGWCLPSPNGVNVCCHPDQTCNYDAGTNWPALPRCLN